MGKALFRLELQSILNAVNACDFNYARETLENMLLSVDQLQDDEKQPLIGNCDECEIAIQYYNQREINKLSVIDRVELFF